MLQIEQIMKEYSNKYQSKAQPSYINQRIQSMKKSIGTINIVIDKSKQLLRNITPIITTTPTRTHNKHRSRHSYISLTPPHQNKNIKTNYSQFGSDNKECRSVDKVASNNQIQLEKNKKIIMLGGKNSKMLKIQRKANESNIQSELKILEKDFSQIKINQYVRNDSSSLIIRQSTDGLRAFFNQSAVIKEQSPKQSPSNQITNLLPINSTKFFKKNIEKSHALEKIKEITISESNKSSVATSKFKEWQQKLQNTNQTLKNETRQILKKEIDELRNRFSLTPPLGKSSQVQTDKKEQKKVGKWKNQQNCQKKQTDEKKQLFKKKVRNFAIVSGSLNEKELDKVYQTINQKKIPFQKWTSTVISEVKRKNKKWLNF